MIRLPMSLPTPLRIAVLAALLAPAALAQTAGTVLWKTDIQGYAFMSQPHVGPDGTIYLVTKPALCHRP